jgi:hypothetical protein
MNARPVSAQNSQHGSTLGNQLGQGKSCSQDDRELRLESPVGSYFHRTFDQDGLVYSGVPANTSITSSNVDGA